MRWVLSYLVLLGSINAVSAEGQAPTSAIDREVRRALRAWDVPGCAVVVVQRDRVLFLKGYGSGSLGTNSPVGPDTLFPIASCTKSFTSTAVAILVSEGKLNWDDRVSVHLAEFQLSDPHANALVTIRDLLCHRTGVAPHDFLWYRSPLSQDELIQRIRLLPVSGQFRSSFAYQNLMVMAAGKIVGLHHPNGWSGFVSDRILRPLGMTRTLTSEPKDQAAVATLAKGHRRNSEGLIERCESYPQPTPNPAGSIYLTARDLGRWLQFQLGDGTWRGRRLLSAETLAETHRPQSIIPPGDVTRLLSPESVQLTYGMGWVISDYRGIRLVSHAGLVDGFRCQFTLLPDHGLGFGILANLHGTRFNLALSNRLTDLLLGFEERDWHGHYSTIEEAERRAELERQQERQKQRAQAKSPSLDLKDYAGEYRHPAYGPMVIRCIGQRLVWEWSSFRRDLVPVSGDLFEVPEIGMRSQDLQFVVQSGSAYKLRVFDIEFDRCP